MSSIKNSWLSPRGEERISMNKLRFLRYRAVLAIVLVFAMVFGTSGGALASEVSTSVNAASVAAENSSDEGDVAGGTVSDGESLLIEEAEETAESAAPSDEDVVEKEALDDGAIPEGAVTITEDNFPDENLRNAIIKGAIDGITLSSNAGIYYYTKEAVSSADWVSVDLYSKEDGSIASLKGLEKISNIRSLYISGMDKLTSMPELGELQKLDSFGLNDVAVSKLDLSRNADLNCLSLADVPITELDLSKNTKLEDLSLFYVPITKLDSIPEISSLTLSNIPLTELDVNGLKKVNYLNIRNVPLENFDFSSLSDGLCSLSLKDMNIPSLDVSRYKALETLRFENSTVSSGSIVGLNELRSLDELDLSGSNVRNVSISCDNLYTVCLDDCGELANLEVSWVYDEYKRISCRNCCNLKRVKISGAVDDRYNWGWRDDETGIWHLPDITLDFVACTALEDVDIAVGNTGKLPVSANLIYDFRYVMGDFNNGSKFKIQTEKKYDNAIVTIKSTEGSWIAEKFPDKVENGNPVSLELGATGFDPVLVGTKIHLVNDYEYKSFNDKSNAIRYTVENAEEETLPSAVIDTFGLSVSSDNPSVAEVNGKDIDIKDTGTAKITVECGTDANKLSRSFYIRAYRQTTGITTTPNAITVAPRAVISTPVAITVNPAEGTEKVTAELTPSDGVPGVWWHVFGKENKELTTPDGITVVTTGEENGKTTATVTVMKGTEEGEYTIRADAMGNYSEDGGLISSIIKLIVKGGGDESDTRPLEGVKLDKSDISLTAGQKTSLTASVQPDTADCTFDWTARISGVSENNIDKYIVFSTSGNKANITAKQAGEVEITVVAEDLLTRVRKTATAHITITDSDFANIDDETVSANDQVKIAAKLSEEAEKEKDAKLLWISGLKDEYTYYGANIEPEVAVYYGTSRLRLGKDYSIKFSNKKNPGASSAVGGLWGTGKITVKGKGNYTGTVEQEFSIINGVNASAASIKKAKIVSLNKSYDYTGSAVRPDIAVELGTSRLKKGEDYLVSYSKNIDAGTANIVVSGIGNYKDTVKKTFKITAVDLKKAKESGKVTVSVNNASFRVGGAIPVVSVIYKGDGVEWTLREGADYKLGYKKNKTPGTKGTVTITGQGNFTRKTDIEFNVTKGDLSELTMNVKDLKFKTNQKKGTAFKSTAKIIDKDGKNLSTKDYTLEYRDLTAGIILDEKTSRDDVAKVKAGHIILVSAVPGSRNYYTGKLTGTYYLRDVSDINKARADKIADQAYDGKEKKPDIILKDSSKQILKEGVDYRIVEYRNNINKGNATVLIKGIGEKYSGTKVVSFKIVASKVQDSYLGYWNNGKFVTK